SPRVRPPPSSSLFPYTTLFRSSFLIRGTRISSAAGGSEFGQFFFEFGLARRRELIKDFTIHKQLGIGFRFCQAFDDRSRRLVQRSEEHTSELQSRSDLVCRLLL